jgi:hypothetical protein
VTHTEIVHVYFGAGTILTASALLWARYRPNSAARFVWPTLTLLLGLFHLIPVEAQTRTYLQVGWWDTFLSAFPSDLGAWIAMLAKIHVVQHKAAGVLAIWVGAVELGRATGRLTADWWRWSLPVCLVGIGLLFSIHGGTHTHLPHRVEQVHHWIFGTCFVAAGSLLALVEADRLRQPAWRTAWILLVLVAGLDLTLFYRLPPHS